MAAKSLLLRLFQASIILLLLAAGCAVPDSARQHDQDMVFVPAGDFIMGTNGPRPTDDGPEHTLWLDSFWIDTYEVTNARYRLCVLAGDCPEPGDLRFYDDPAYADHPVVYVTWFAARDYCHWVGKRLPAEAEWEKAARGEQGRIYPWGNELDPGRLNAGQRLDGTTAVGSFPSGASPYGALDMAGNVWEWVEDWYAAYPGSTYQSDFFGEKYKVVRGGSWNHPDEDARPFHRDLAHPARTIRVVGFRCAADNW